MGEASALVGTAALTPAGECRLWRVVSENLQAELRGGPQLCVPLCQLLPSAGCLQKLCSLTSAKNTHIFNIICLWASIHAVTCLNKCCMP